MRISTHSEAPKEQYPFLNEFLQNPNAFAEVIRKAIKGRDNAGLAPDMVEQALAEIYREAENVNRINEKMREEELEQQKIALTNELKSILIGKRIQKVQQPTKNDILLTIRLPEGNRKLYICVNPQYPHLALINKESEVFRNIQIPQIPPMFCMLLRKHMEGCKINDIKQPSFDRIFEIYFDSYSELGQKVPMVLSCEFMGKYSNIILYNYETNVILGCAHNVSSEKSREREVAGGLPYIYPPKQNKFERFKR